MKFYIASSLANKEKVAFVSEQLVEAGHTHTYDWTLNGEVTSLEHLATIGQLERQAVLDADVLVVLMPAGKGSHVEMGIALGQNKKVFLFSTNDEVNALETTSAFYHLPEVEIVIGVEIELLERMRKFENKEAQMNITSL